MIRYRTLDHAVSGSDFSGIPGIGMFTEIIGRSQDVVVSRKGALMSLVGLAPVMAQFNEIENFRFIQDEAGRLDLQVVHSSDNSAVHESIINGIKNALGEEYEVTVMDVNEIPPSPAGKNTFLQQNLELEKYY